MDVAEFFSGQQDLISGGLHSAVLAGLQSDDVRRHPPGQNSIAWLVWHTARWQDVIAMRWIAQSDQVFDAAGYFDRFGIPTRAAGTGMTTADAEQLSQAADLDAVVEYWDAVADATKRVVHGLRSGDLSRVVTDDERRMTVADGAYNNPLAPWLDEFFVGKSVAWYAMFLPIHGTEHLIGEALSIRGQIGRSAGI